MACESSRAVGIFDSGVGGLTVHRRIVERLPNENVVYLGDTARVPYGTKSANTVERYAQNCAGALLKEGIKLLVVACNTASAYALESLRDNLDIPVLGVVEPGAQRAAQQTRNGRIGIIGTTGTIASGEYQRAIERYAPESQVYCTACPLFVPLAEEGWVTGGIPEQIVHHYLAALLDARIDTLVLGCTHYPLLKDAIGAVVGPDVFLVDSAEATAAAVADTIEGLGIARTTEESPERRFLVTDDTNTFARVGALFLGEPITNVHWVDF